MLSAEKDNIVVEDSLFSVEIKRDDWGVPHIYGKTDADVSFGLAYAHSQDDYATLQDVIYALRGELASIYGRNFAVNDYYVHLMNYWGMIDERYESDVADDVKLVCEGYAAGINKFLHDNPDLKKRSFNKVICRRHHCRILPSYAINVWT
ncbi:MAG: penicillin acylase family protein [Candidatus Neomarinimicrobiota bacterium]